MIYAGHGHVFARADGVRSDCGGPRLCDVCRIELGRLTFMTMMLHKLLKEWCANPSEEICDIVHRGRLSGAEFDGSLRTWLDARAAERIAAAKKEAA